MIPVFNKNFGEGLELKTTALSVFFLWLVNSVNNNTVDHLEKCGLFLISNSSMVLGLFNQLQIFLQLYLIELLVLLTRQAPQAMALDISKAFDRVWHTGLLHRIKSCGISGRYLALFLLFILATSSGSGWEIFTRISS